MNEFRPIPALLAASALLCVAPAYDPVRDQLLTYRQSDSGQSIVQTRYGVPVSRIATSLTAGSNGPMLMEDVVFFDQMAHFTRERIPDRVMHARGTGSFGYFEVTKDISHWCKAKLFEKIGKRTRIAVRFSPDTMDKGQPETTRAPVGFAIKFYTDDGIWDILGYNSPVFFIRDPLLFPLLMHASNRNPVTNVEDKDMRWDFYTRRPESVHHLMYLYSDNGIPDGYRHMAGFGQHAFKMVNASGHPTYVKFHFPAINDSKYLTDDQAADIRVTDPDYDTRDLFNAIGRGDFPKWGLYIQVMTFEQAETFRWNPFDVTKIWPIEDYPLTQIGMCVLNENPTNFFADVEQLALSPSHLVPGIEATPDRMLQARLFSYSDTQRYRVGPNHDQLPVNCPLRGVKNYERDGPQTFYNQGGAPNYYPNSFGGPINEPNASISRFFVSGDVQRYNTSNDDNFSQPKMYWDTLTQGEKDRVVGNFVKVLTGVLPLIQERAVDMFSKVDPALGRGVAKGLKIIA